MIVTIQNLVCHIVRIKISGIVLEEKISSDSQITRFTFQFILDLTFLTPLPASDQSIGSI